MNKGRAHGGLSLSVRARRHYLTFAALVAPVVFLRLFTAAYPIAETVRLSLTNLSLVGGTSEFIGFQNYPTLFEDFGVRSAVSFTIAFVAVSTLLQLVVGLLLALLLNASFPGRPFARAINLIPWAIPPIVAAYAFRWILDDQFGMIPHWVYLASGERSAPLISPLGAQVLLIVANVWKNAPFMAVVFLAGLQGVPEELYEAARVDGANAWQRFRSITVPMVTPLMITMGMFFVVWQLASFDLVYGMTGGGPGVATMVLALRIFQEGLLFFKFGFASALSVLLLLLVSMVGLAGLLLFRRMEVRL